MARLVVKAGPEMRPSPAGEKEKRKGIVSALGGTFHIGSDSHYSQETPDRLPEQPVPPIPKIDETKPERASVEYCHLRELRAYLQDNDFKTFIVSGGDVEFIRRFAERAYAIPPGQVVGSSGAVTFESEADGAGALVKEPKMEFVDGGPGKPVGINRVIGRRPSLAFGSSDGDLEMRQYIAAGRGPRFMGLLRHTDAESEWAYARASHAAKLENALDEATANGWTVVDIKADWNVVFAAEERDAGTSAEGTGSGEGRK